MQVINCDPDITYNMPQSRIIGSCIYISNYCVYLTHLHIIANKQDCMS